MIKAQQQHRPLDEAAAGEIRQARGKFLALAATYSLGTFNDNFFKQAACLLAIAAGLPELQGYAAAVFTLPFVLFAAPAGYLADRFPKRRIIIASKVMEVAAMSCGAVGLCTGNWTQILVMVFMTGLQATIFSPALNGSIPELYPEHYVLKANSILKMVVTMAILLGIILACLALGHKQVIWHGVTAGRLIVSAGVLTVAMVGLAVSLGVPARPAADPAARFPWTGPLDTIRTLGDLRGDGLLTGTIGLDAFTWFAAALQVQLINYIGMVQFHMAESTISYLLVPELAGVAIGGLVCGRLAAPDRWYRVLAPAAVVMGAAMTAIAAVPLLPVSLHGVPAQLAGSCGLLFVAGLGGGVLLVPLEAFIQARPPADRKGHVIAAANFTAFLGVMASGLVFVGLSRIVTPAEGFGLLGGLTILVGLAVWMRVKRHA